MLSKFKGPRKSVLHSGRPSYPVYHLSRVYCTRMIHYVTRRYAKLHIFSTIQFNNQSIHIFRNSRFLLWQKVQKNCLTIPWFLLQKH